MAGCQRGLSLSMLVTHGYNNIITCIWSIWNSTKKTITKNVQLSIAFSRTESLHSTLHRSHWTLSANNPTCCSRPIITSLLLSNTVKRLNGLFKSAIVIWSIRSADILDAHGDHTSTIRLLLIFSPDAAVLYVHN